MESLHESFKMNPRINIEFISKKPNEGKCKFKIINSKS